MKACYQKQWFKDRLNAFDNFKNKQKSNVFGHVKGFIFWKCFQYTVHWDKTQIFKKFPSGKRNGTKNNLLFLSRAPAHHSFILNLWFLYEVKPKLRLSNCVWNFPFSILFCFYWSLYFCSAKCMDSLTLNLLNSFQNKNNGKMIQSFVSRPLSFKQAWPWVKCHRCGNRTP